MTSSPFLFALRDGWERFRANPAGEAVAAALFLLASLTGILFGPAALIYLWRLAPKGRDPFAEVPFASNLLLLQRLQGTRRVSTAFWLGLGIWAFTVLPFFHHVLLLGIPLGVVLAQPLWLALAVADRFDLPLGVACRAVFRLLADAPGRAFPCLAFGLLAWAGILLFGIGILLTTPIALRALLRYLEGCERELAAAVQGAYR